MNPEQEIERLERETTRRELLEEMNRVMDQALACQSREEAWVFLRQVIVLADEGLKK